MTRTLAVAAVVALWSCGDGGGGGTGGGAGGGGGGDVGAVAKIELAPELALVVIGQTVQLVPTALDANGAVLGGIPFTFTSSEPSVASMDQGLMTALAEGATLVSASANGVTSNFAVVTVLAQPPQQAPSDSLIADALGAGRIDEETALLYRVYATFGDARLPLEYAGVDDDVPDSDALDVVRERWDTLSPATQALLEPFFAPPAYLGSWASLDRKPRALIEICKRPVPDPNWAAIPATGGRVKVWYDTRAANGLAQAQKVLAAFETTIWDAVTSPSGLAMKPPKTDGAETGCNGGDDRLDVFLADMGAHGQVATNLGETTSNIIARKSSPTYIVLNRGLSDRELLGSAAHEFMHACQWAYDVSALGLSAYQWLKESTAQEAVDHVYPMNDLEQSPQKLRAYLDAPANPIHEGSVDRFYGSYLFFQFLVRSGTAPVIGAIWNKTTATSDQLEAVDLGIPGGLEQQWPEYARTLWNDKPVSDQSASFAKWDTMFEKPSHVYADGNLGGRPESSSNFAVEAQNVSTRFVRVGYSDAATRSLMFHNTFFQLHRAGKPIFVRALWKLEDGTWSEEDWSDLEWVGFCRDQKDQRVEDLVVIVASAQKSGSAITASTAPTIAASNLPCWGLSGTATRVTHDSQYVSGASTLTVTARYGGRPALQLTDPTTGLLRVPVAGPLFDSGTSTFNEDYSDAGGCRYQANGSFSHTGVDRGGDVGSSWVVNLFADALPIDVKAQQLGQLGTSSRAYSGTGVSTRVVQGSVTGPAGCTGTHTVGLGDFLLTQKSPADMGGVVKLAATDGTFSGTLVDGDSTFTWSFTPLREP